MSVLCLNVCTLCVPNIMSLGICFVKKCISSTLVRLLDTASKFALFSASRLKDEQLIKKQTYMKTETCKLYSRVLVRERSALADPYCHSAWNSVGSRALSFSGPLLSVSVEFCLFVKEYQELTPLSRICTRMAHAGVPYFQMGREKKVAVNPPPNFQGL